ncbi:FERRY endosomal RAB5 effector complex subunit 3-like isoform X1 [Styela clava]
MFFANKCVRSYLSCGLLKCINPAWFSEWRMVLLQDCPDPYYERTFTYTFSNRDDQSKKTFTLQLNISEPQNIDELSSRIAGHHNMPCFVEGNLKEALNKFVESEKIKLSHDVSMKRIERFNQNPVNAAEIEKSVAMKYGKTWAGFTKFRGFDDNGEFSTMYHKLIHSQAMYILLSLEENYYHCVQKVISDQENSMLKLRERQELEMQRACEHINSSLYTEADVNELADKQSADTERLLGDWRKKYAKQVENQRKEYRNVVSRLYAEMIANDGKVDEHGHTYNEVKKILDLSSKSSDINILSPYVAQQHEPRSGKQVQKGSKSAVTNDSLVENVDEISSDGNFNAARLEESFTINLGAQMKTMHNIRLIAAPILQYCRHSNQSGDVQAQRLQTILSLYSNSLSGLILLSDNSIDSVSGLKSEFSSICEESTEFHFPQYREQLTEIKSRSVADGTFQDGDFYVTKHSNLSKVHIVFHLAANTSSLRSSESSATMSSRHSVILGLRHILKVMSSHDVGTLSVPILLCHELSAKNDEAWIVKRAELVMKCLKGFMMEMAAWDGGISRTMQFVVPPDISDRTFYRLSAMLPEIFRTTSARNLTSSKVSSSASQNKH